MTAVRLVKAPSQSTAQLWGRGYFQLGVGLSPEETPSLHLSIKYALPLVVANQDVVTVGQRLIFQHPLPNDYNSTHYGLESYTSIRRTDTKQLSELELYVHNRSSEDQNATLLGSTSSGFITSKSE